jgi:hypothetical protein
MAAFEGDEDHVGASADRELVATAVAQAFHDRDVDARAHTEEAIPGERNVAVEAHG